ncbi:UvrD-helicase domain-containing protein [uncultured Chryseobacterium sp.]|uniref:UvrD-helicase domain-containing protein n=1 Tax=uncultured Chryseobacterium sp. TaxID=259322 RepID=UPI0025CEBF76|nr:UvrD-helicase domain-containing protein [uncultured Chryseobacterium sp.]
MNLTKEQQDIINSSGNIKINAVAGSGKTTTVIEYAGTRPAGSKILYLVFNKAVRIEAAKKFADRGLHNVRVETAHSLAFRHIVFQYNYKVRAQGYKTHEIAALLNLQGNGEKHAEYIVANHINKCIAYFCNSDKRKVQELNYLDTVTDPKAKAFVSTFYDYIIAQTRLLLSKMDKGEIEVTHDFYLKKFQLLNPELGYDYILFDEGQDASPAMLDLFFNQKAVKVIVGDTHQQIYSWRYAVNSLEKADFTTHHLSTSFRFGQDIADLASEVLDLKTHLYENFTNSVSIMGAGKSKQIKTRATLARTNLGLLLKAIEYVTENKKSRQIYFEGNISSYTYADEGASLYDVLNLYTQKRHLIRDELIRSMKDLAELEDYIEKTEDVQLSLMVEIIKEYESEIPEIINTIKKRHVANNDKEDADMIFSTVHRCKGMEYDSVELVNDFISEKRLEKLKEDKKNFELNIPKTNEEINLLYVAVTRAKSNLSIPETLLPDTFIQESPSIHVIKVKEEDDVLPKKTFTGIKTKDKTEKTYSVEKIRTTHKGAYKPWTQDEDDELAGMFSDGCPIKEIADHLGRTKGAIVARIKKLELEDFY